jgi:hypothetical protein
MEFLLEILVETDSKKFYPFGNETDGDRVFSMRITAPATRCCDLTCCNDKENRSSPLDLNLAETMKNSIDRSHPLDEAINAPFNG